MPDDQFRLLPPPRLLPEAELPPVIEPPLRELPAFPAVGTVEDWEPVASEPTPRLLQADLTRTAHEAANADDRIRRALDGKRHRVIGARVLDEKGQGGEATTSRVVVVFYNYTDDVTVEAHLDAGGNEVVEIAEGDYQPPPIQDEIDRALELARADRRLEGRITDDLEGRAILVSSADPDDPGYRHRQFFVSFGYPDERLPRHTAVVDLSTEMVMSVRAGHRADPDHQGRQP